MKKKGTSEFCFISSPAAPLQCCCWRYVASFEPPRSDSARLCVATRLRLSCPRRRCSCSRVLSMSTRAIVAIYSAKIDNDTFHSPGFQSRFATKTKTVLFDFDVSSEPPSGADPELGRITALTNARGRPAGRSSSLCLSILLCSHHPSPLGSAVPDY